MTLRLKSGEMTSVGATHRESGRRFPMYQALTAIESNDMENVQHGMAAALLLPVNVQQRPEELAQPLIAPVRTPLVTNR